MLLNCLLVGIGGFVGAVGRYLLSLLPLGTEGGFPYKTLLINIAGAFAIGLLAALASRKAIDSHWLLLLKVGVCGGFTTFSTFALEAHTLLRQHHPALSLLYCLLSVALCLAAVAAGGAVAGEK